MGRITLVCSAHRESGECNKNELLKILMTVGPDVIFEEIRPGDFESFYADESKYSVEMRAIKEYMKGRKARQVSVDDYDMPSAFVPYMRALEEFVASRSGAYRDVVDEMDRKKYELGFSYLNSSEFISRIKESERLYHDTVFKHGNDLAKSKLEEWNSQIRRRDASMLENIYRFCQQTDFIEGVLLVGAGHMSSIMDGIEHRMKDQPTVVAWRFWNGS